MLVLTRKVGESIRIADSITVTVLDRGRGQVRLGVEAPPQVPVLREELRERPGNDHPTPPRPGKLIPSPEARASRRPRSRGRRGVDGRRPGG